jgi:hypothetical protein
MAAPLPTPTGVARFRLMHLIYGATLYGCKFDVAYSAGPPSTADLSTLADAVFAAYDANLKSLLGTAVELVEVIAEDRANPSTPDGISTASPIVGTRSGTVTSAGIAAAVIFTPDRKYRGSKPKMFAPWGVDGDVTSEHQWSSGFQSAVVAAWGAFMGAVTGQIAGSSTLGEQVCISYTEPPYTVVISPTTGRGRNVGTVRTPPLVKGITAIQLSPRLGSQRRRLQG